MAVKVTLFYNQVGSGWTETWYHGSSDPKSLISNTLTAFVLKSCIDFRHALTYLIAARATKIGGGKESFTRSYGTKYKGLSAGVGEPGPDVVSTDAVLKVDGIQTGVKRMFIRGLNDFDAQRNIDGTDKPSGALTAGLTNYLNAMAGSGFALRILRQPPNVGLAWVPVISVATVAGIPTQTDVKTTVDVAAPIAVGDYVRFSRVPGDALPGFPGKAVVLEMNPGGVSGVRISYNMRGSPTVFPPSMQLTALVYDYPVISRVDTGFFSILSSPLTIERFSEHKTGRPFGLLRGRARSKVRAH